MHALPVISHRVRSGANAHRETIGPGGFFAGNFHEYVEYMNRFISDSQLRSLIGLRGLTYATENYSLDSAADRLAQIYGYICPSEFPLAAGVNTLNGNQSKIYIFGNSFLALIRRVKDKIVYTIKLLGK
jgi:hypothetical protein